MTEAMAQPEDPATPVVEEHRRRRFGWLRSTVLVLLWLPAFYGISFGRMDLFWIFGPIAAMLGVVGFVIKGGHRSGSLVAGDAV